MKEKIEILSTVKNQHSSELYKIVDLLNSPLKENNLKFGLAFDQEDQKKSVFTIYRT